jgi:hypothetical protein
MIVGNEILPSPPLTQPPIINYTQSSDGHKANSEEDGAPAEEPITKINEMQANPKP